MDKYKKALAVYVAVLAKSSIETTFTSDQNLYQLHLAQSALMFLAIEKDSSIEKLKQIVGMVRQVFQLNPLHGQPGKKSEIAFETFAQLVDVV